jgi:hypothetical protein
MEGLDAETVSKRAAVPRVVHWAGFKKARQRDMIGADLPAYFEEVYYQRVPAPMKLGVSKQWDSTMPRPSQGSEDQRREDDDTTMLQSAAKACRRKVAKITGVRRLVERIKERRVWTRQCPGIRRSSGTNGPPSVPRDTMTLGA